MASGASAYLVVRRSDGFGDVFPLTPGQRYTIGRANTNLIVLKDEVCSREHAEVYFAEGCWRLRDMNSLNGTRVNEEKLDSEWELSPKDEVQLGRTNFVFVEEIEQLPDLPFIPAPAEKVTIKKRLRNTRFLTPDPQIQTANGAGTVAANGAGTIALEPTQNKRGLTRDLALLYRLALDMGSAAKYPDLVRIVLTGLLEATQADAGAILSCNNGHDVELLDYRHRDPNVHGYIRVSQFLSNEVLSSKEAILAENVAHHPDLVQRDSIHGVGAQSLICAPVVFGDEVLGIIHLYCTSLHKSLDSDDLEFVLAVARQFGASSHQIQRQVSLTAENQALNDQLRVETEMVGNDPGIKKIENQIAMVARTHATVLIRGESGTGKELVARAIHNASPRKEGPFVCLNCAALPESLLESELFGHEKGAFTGATEKKIGKFESAHRGTIFLDEIGEMNSNSQAKLLRILEGHPFERVGGHVQIRVDTRVVAATNHPLEKGLQAGTFRRDLFYRLQVVEINLPTLRERKSDIPLLAEHFLKRYIRETGRKVHGFTPAALKKMEEYHWPGNIRELRNVIERAVALGFGPVMDASDIWLSSADSLEQGASGASENSYQPKSLEDMEKEQILRTLHYTDWNKSQAASILRIERSTLDRKIKLYDLKR
jgi:transcriptional regulator with GAF, ATPase, and Fis domain